MTSWSCDRTRRSSLARWRPRLFRDSWPSCRWGGEKRGREGERNKEARAGEVAGGGWGESWPWC